ncbi:MAG TPA: TadE/TadG family type IV pilus assembly protein [Gaiellaceae bacterium]|nr:TadE/TadG family type IV pilus assembly protein [Gaiellaceae bacterium]
MILDCGKRVGRRCHRRASDESGQVLTITAIAMTLMIVTVGLVVDVGHAMLVQRQLQAGVDAAALAGAQHLPDRVMAESVAVQYSATPGQKNSVNTVGNATTTAQAKCLAGVPGCNRRDNGVNGVVVSSHSKVPTWFGRIIGIDHIEVNATATACSPCTVKPLDIMIVLDRTGSMCQFGPGQNDPNCTDLKNAQDGVRTFVQFLDPTLDKVGLALTPPALDASWISNCGNPSGSGYKPWTGTPNPNVPSGDPRRSIGGRYYGYDAWWPHWLSDGRTPPSTPSRYVVASLEGADGQTIDDYLVQDPVDGSWDLGTQSAFLQRLGCTSGQGTTSYALSIEEAQQELNTNGRGNVQDVIIFLSDGAANTTPLNVPSGHWTRSMVLSPCAAGVQAAANAKAAGTIVYTIGYDLDAGSGAPEKCRQPNSSDGHSNGSNPVESGLDAFTAIQAMATDPDGAGPAPAFFYNKPNPGDLTQIFTAIAQDLAGSRGRLIDNNSPSLP